MNQEVWRPLAQDKRFPILSFQNSVYLHLNSATQNSTAGRKGKKKSTNNPQSAEKQSSYIAFIILPAVPLFFSRGEQSFTYKGLTLKD